MKCYVQVVEYGTGEIIERIECDSERKAETLQNVININLNHKKFYTNIDRGGEIKISIKDEIIDFIYENINQSEFEYELSDEELDELEKYGNIFCDKLYETIGKSAIEIIDEGIPGFKTLKIVKNK